MKVFTNSMAFSYSFGESMTRRDISVENMSLMTLRVRFSSEWINDGAGALSLFF